MNNIDVSILVNGSTVSKYHDNGQIYIQANEGSEYEIKINNSNPYRVLAIASVDGLSVMTGKTAGTNDAGYIIGAYGSYKIKGFRYSNDSVGAFKFSKKEDSYAATKGKKAKRNCGVIGICVYKEKEIPVPVTSWNNHYHNDWYWFQPNRNPLLDLPLYSDTSTTYGSSITSKGNLLKSDVLRTYGAGGQSVNLCLCSSQVQICDTNTKLSNATVSSFDMGSTWGKNKESKVVQVEFERGEVVLTQDIYYASRMSLVNMGIIEDSKPKVSFPKSFPEKYAEPPSGWRG